MDPVEVDLPDAEELDDPFKRRVAVLIVLITLFGAVVAYLQARASVEENKAARDSQRAAIAGLGAQLQASADVNYAYGVWVESRQFERLRVLDGIRSRQAGLAEPAEQAYRAAAERWAIIKSTLDPLSPLLADGRYTEEGDPFFSVRFESDAGIAPDIAALTQEAAGETADGHSNQESSYVAVITMLAVALFLLGLSLTIGGRVRSILVTPALALVAWCVFATGLTALRGVPVTPDQAARHVAQGNALVAQREFESALNEYDAAIQLRSDYGTAYGRRADAFFLRGTTQVQQQYVSITNPEDLRLSIADGERAIQFGAAGDVNVVGNLGFHYFLDRRYSEGEDLTLDAIDLNPDIPSLWLNLGLIRAARGDDEGAEEAYEEGVRLLLLRPDRIERDDLFAAARTDLEILIQQEPDLIDKARQFQEFLVAEESAAVLDQRVGSPRPGARFYDFEFTFAAGDVTALYDYEDVPPGTSLAFIWYIRPDPGVPWAEEPLITSFEMSDLDPAGAAQIVRSPASCPLPGDYRLDVYVEAVLSGSGEASLAAGSLGLLVPYFDEVVGVSLCRPTGWSVEPNLFGDLVFFIAPDDELAFGVSAVPATATGDPVEVERVTLENLGADIGAVHPRDPGTEPQPFAFGGVDGTLAYYTSDELGTVAIAASLGDDSILRTAVAIGPDDRIEELNQILNTLTFSF